MMPAREPGERDLRAELEALRRRVEELEAARAEERRARAQLADLPPTGVPPAAAPPADEPGPRREGDVIGYQAATVDAPSTATTERALRALAERYALIESGTGAGLYDLHFRRRRGYLSPRWKELVGFDGDDAFMGEIILQERLHPEDRARYAAARRDHLERREPFSVEVRIRDPNGGYRWIHVIAQAQWDRDGQPVRLVGSLYDVTTRKQIEEAVREQQRAQGQLEGVTFAAREIAHRLNNELAVVLGTLELVQQVESLPRSLRELLEDANHELEAAAQHLVQLQQVVRVETRDTPVGPALDLERSVEPEP